MFNHHPLSTAGGQCETTRAGRAVDDVSAARLILRAIDSGQKIPPDLRRGMDSDFLELALSSNRGDLKHAMAAIESRDPGRCEGIRAAFETAAESLNEAAVEVVPPEAEDDGPIVANWPDPLDKAAFHGLAGDFVRIVEPHSEADRVALLTQFLVFFGSLVGRTAFVPIESDRHYANDFLCLVGESALAQGNEFRSSQSLLRTGRRRLRRLTRERAFQRRRLDSRRSRSGRRKPTDQKERRGRRLSRCDDRRRSERQAALGLRSRIRPRAESPWARRKHTVGDHPRTLGSRQRSCLDQEPIQSHRRSCVHNCAYHGDRTEQAAFGKRLGERLGESVSLDLRAAIEVAPARRIASGNDRPRTACQGSRRVRENGQDGLRWTDRPKSFGDPPITT